MKIVTWNVNSVTVRLPQVLDYLACEVPDVLALQETKVPDEKFPAAEIEAAGYHVVYAGQNSYNGVALLAREPVSDLVCDLPGLADPQRRLLAATIDGVRVVNVYIPNGQEVGSDKYAYKLRWLQALYDFLQGEMTRYPRLVFLGDFNIAPTDLDVHDPVRWDEKITCSAGERAWFDALLALGLIDGVRGLHPDEALYSWWDYRMSAFRRGWGLRIDHVLVSRAIKPLSAGVSLQPRMLERPSDHAPVWLQLV